jgi:hemolysin activation/secretion protein
MRSVNSPSVKGVPTGKKRASRALERDGDLSKTRAIVQLNAARRLSRRGLELRVRLTGQMSDGILYSGERLGIGGESSVRGYRESLILADRGLVGSIELAQPFNLSGNRAARGNFDWGAFSAGLFLEGAQAWNARGPAPIPSGLASIGPSLAWQPSDALTLDLAWGIALTRARITGSRDLEDHGFHFRLTVHPLRLFHRTQR